MAVSITQKPNRNASSVGAPVREGNGSYKMTVKWNANDWIQNDSNKGRCEGWEISWAFHVYDLGTKKARNLISRVKYNNPRLRQHAVMLTNLKCTDGKTYNRYTHFYPNGNLILQYVTVYVRPYNRKGVGSWVTGKREFTTPRNPSVAIKQDENTGVISYTAKHNKGQDYRECYDTYVTFEVYEMINQVGKVSRTDKRTFRSTEDSHTWTLDITNRMDLSYNDYVRVRIKAYSRGIRGVSETVSQDYYVSWPMKTTIGGVEYSSKDTTGKVTLKIDTNYHTSSNQGVAHPVTGIRLEKLVNVEWTQASQIPGDADWQKTDSADNGNCSALSSTVALLQPEAGNTTWVRVKSWNDIEDIFYRYSDPFRLTGLEQPAPTAADDRIVFGDAISGDDGKSAILTLGWPSDDSTGTQVAWSDSEYAWRSNDEPSTHDFTWDDGSGQIGSETYAHTARFYVGNLNEGTRYYFRARRYLDNGSDTEYGPWCPSDTSISVMPTTSPDSVVLDAPLFIARNAGLFLSWTFDSDSEQTMWEILTGPTTVTTETVTRTVGSETVTSTVEHLWIDEAQAKVVASGDDAAGSTVISAERLAGLVGTDESVALAVRMRTGGDPVTSEAVSVDIADRPTVNVTTSATISAQPFSIAVECSVAASLRIVAKSGGGNSRELPTGIEYQPEGDAVWSIETTPDWAAATDEQTGEVTGYTATITAPSDLELWDDGEYDVSIVATDPRTLLESEEATATFEVGYAHRPPTPTDAITVTASDATDTDGTRTLSAVIQLAATADMATTDVYDVYRVTPDGAYLIARDLSQAESVTDPYAPFGTGVTLAYRVAVRTADGIQSWMDYEYGLKAWMVRIDWDTGYVELPYNLQVGDQWEKDFEARRHMDGSIGGYWNPGAMRVASIATDLIRRKDPEQVRRVKELANYCGACIVRTPDGCCYQANVTPNTLSWTYNGGAIPLSLDVTEVALTEEYMAVRAIEEEEPEEEP